MREGTAARFEAEFALSAETTRSDAGPEAQAIAIKMSGERAAELSMAERAKNAKGSGAMSGLKIGMRAKSLADIVVSLISRAA